MADAKEQDQAQAGETIQADDFANLLQQEFKPKSERAQSEVEAGVRTLAEQVLADSDLITDDALNSISAIVAEIDATLTEQLNLIMHSDEFQKIESAWRGLHHLVNNTNSSSQLKIRVMNISKKELGKTLKRFKGANWDQSPIFKKIYGEEYDQLGGEPYGCLVGDYHFDHSPQDVEMLQGIAEVAAASHAPFIGGADPAVLQMEDWQELSNPRDLNKIFNTPEYASWNSMRDQEDARYLSLAMPRFLARLPYGAKTDPVEEFDFEEDTEGADSANYSWANSAYAMAVNINQAFEEYGWCTSIRGVESGGLVTDLHCHTFPTDDGSVDMKCPTEIAIGDRREKELSDAGFLPLLHRKNTDLGVFMGGQTLNRPVQYDDPEATKNAELSARLPYMFATCRFAHYLKCIVRDKIGSFTDRAAMEKWLNDWILNYVDGDPENSTQETKARKPLAGAEVVVEEDPANPGYYKSQFFLRPHYQLEGLTVSLRLVGKLPSEAGG